MNFPFDTCDGFCSCHGLINVLNIIFTLNAHTVRPGSSDPPEKIFDIFASENEVYTIY